MTYGVHDVARAMAEVEIQLLRVHLCLLLQRSLSQQDTDFALFYTYRVQDDQIERELSVVDSSIAFRNGAIFEF
ncbi:hypothetical protein JTE90_026043 [Oedothorax gibbosus]|uniref:Uncharacterized protein n=1 Tax=Oedothorax gibbosus TaxID=931172 RepID=A0AAV6UDG1_9ARAC|nr:hypothetical protein JTE90_026043 [Oedothorax gibbosus]